MSEEKKSRSKRRRKHHRRGSYRGNKLVQFVSQYKYQLLVMAALLLAAIAVLVFLIVELGAEEEFFVACRMMNRV